MAKVCCILACCLLMAPLSAQPPRLRLDVATADAAGRPVAGVHIELTFDQRTVQAADTNELGVVSFQNLAPGSYAVTATKKGLANFQKRDVELAGGNLSLEVMMVALLSRAENIEVRGAVLEVEESASRPNTLPPEKAKELPSRPATVADVLPLTPGVLREPGGALILSSSPESRSALIVNSADVTDPATGQFGLTVPIDSVEVLNVYQAAYMAEYGRFTAGLVSVETKRGGEKWKWELNDPLPEFRIRSHHLRGLKTATPRVNFEGPLIASKLFLSQGLEYEIRKTAIYTLPFPFNQKNMQGFNSFSQLDWAHSSRHLLTTTLHIAPQRLDSLTLDYFNPRPTSPDAWTRNVTGTVNDHLTLWGGLFENRFSVTDFDGAVWGKGPGGLRIAPTGNSGYYFADQRRTATRISGNSSYSFAPLARWGTHQFKIGAYFASSQHSGDIVERPIDIVDMAGHVLLNIQFPRTRNFEIGDVEKAYYAQDHWIVTPRFALDLGFRIESQQISGAVRGSPRIGFSWTPSAKARTVIRGGAGYFYDRVPLNVYAFNRYPGRLITFYDAAGDILSGPTLFLNTLGQGRVRSPFISQTPTDGNFSPQSLVWSIQLEQPVTTNLKLRATYLRNAGDGLVILNRAAPDPETNQGAYLLEGVGASRYRQFDLIAQVRLRQDRELFLSYTHSRARGDLNDFGRYLGTVVSPVIHENRYGTLGTDLPDRFLLWGVFRLPLKFQVAPVIEYRNGFPYVRTNAAQQYDGIPNSTRYPHFLSIDSRFSKDLQVSPKYSVRLSLTAFNFTDHFNPEQVHHNTADPACGYFFGHRGRRFTADFDFLF